LPSFAIYILDDSHDTNIADVNMQYRRSLN